MQDSLTALAACAIVAAAAVFSAALIVILGPWLARYAVAKPNPRSSHKAPTPQGGGIAVIGATILVPSALFFFNAARPSVPLLVLFLAVLLIAAIGALADKRPIGAAPRLVLQTIAVAVMLATLPPELRVFPILPLWSERILMLIGTVWFVNLVNFMDGLDWMTVVEVVPITGTLGVFGLLGYLSLQSTVIGLALCGATIGFAFFNRPVAKLFLGDIGSLPIGLLLGWLLVLLAGSGARTAAVLLPLYYLADSTITLLRRAVRGEAVWQAHRSHFYQRGTDHGFRVIDVVVRVLAMNLVLAALALATIVSPSVTTDILTLSIGSALVTWILILFERGPS